MHRRTIVAGPGMRKFPLGRNGPAVSGFGLGVMAMAGGYGPADDTESVATIQAALDAGISLIDTGDFYGHGHTELLIREAIKGGRRHRAFITVKFGAQRSPDGKFLGDDARPHSVKNFLGYTLKRLGTDFIDLYQPARVDPNVPIEDTVGAIADLVKSGHVRHIGLSEVSAATIRRAHKVHKIRALQIEYSLMSRDIEREILPTLRELGIGLTAYGVLSRGLISDTAQASQSVGEIRARMPRFAAENFQRNLGLVAALRAIATEKGATTAQLAFAWVRAQGDDIFPLIGARQRGQLTEALGAADLKLSADDLTRIADAMPADAVAGQRYMPAVLSHLDSERGG
jgi:aryl-alcohol dehydrogenase-like predicted oxidoreductase